MDDKPMTIKELKELLDQFDDADIVVTSSDAEGNTFSPLATITHGRCIEESTWAGDFIDDDDDSDDINFDGASQAVVLWPTN